MGRKRLNVKKLLKHPETRRVGLERDVFTGAGSIPEEDRGICKLHSVCPSAKNCNKYGKIGRKNKFYQTCQAYNPEIRESSDTVH